MSLDRQQPIWLPIVAVTWLFLILGLFYWVQKPLGPGNAAALARTVLDLGTAGLIGAAGLAAGSGLLRWLRPRDLSAGDRVVLGAGLGLGLLGLFAFGLGLLGWLSRWLLLGLLLLLVAFLWREFAAAVRVVRRLPRPGRGVVLYVGLTLSMALLSALTPPTDWDGLFYHLTGPAWALSAGHIGPPPAAVPHLSFPGLMESLYLLALALRGEVAAKLLHWAFAVLLGGLVYRVAARWLGERARWGAMVALYAIPMVAVLAGWAYNDLALAFFQVAALYALLNAVELRDARWTGVAGLLAGLAMGLKYTSFVCPLALLSLLAWDALRRRSAPKWALGQAALFSGLALAVAAPWYLRNLAFTGNPVYPFAYGLLGGHGWDAWHADWYAQAGTGLGGDVVELVALPFTLTLGLRDMNYFDGRSGPLFLMALPALLAVALFDRRKPRPLNGLLWFALVQFAVWTVGVIGSRSLFQSRLLLTGLVALCPALAYVYEALGRLDRPGFSLQRFAGLVLALILLFNVVYQTLDLIGQRPLPYLVGQESRDAYLSRRLGAHYLAMQAVASLPDGAWVQFLWEPRSYYSGRVVQPDAILETWSYLCEQHGRDVGAIAADLREQDVTHLLLYTAGMEHVVQSNPGQLTLADVAVWEVLCSAYFDVEWEIPGAYVLYIWR